MSETKTQNVKLCTGCGTVKNLETDYYKAGTSWQKLCKVCHNRGRGNYNRIEYQRKPKGFDKLPEETQKKIIYDTYIKINFKKIAAKYDVKYPTLLSWKKKGLIPAYVRPENAAEPLST